MRTTIAAIHRRTPGRWLVPAVALLFLPLLATPADARRGRGGHGGSGHAGYGRHASPHHGSHGTRGHQGYRGQRGDHAYRGQRGHHGYRGRGHHGYRGRGHHGYRGRGHFGYRGHGGYRGYSSFYLSPNRAYRLYSPYVHYSSPRAYGFGAYLYPGISIDYRTTPRYIVRGGGYRVVPAPESGVTERGEPVASEAPLDTRRPPARLELTVEPADASLYLDGQFLGLASELPAELWLDPGAHRLEIARPGYAGRDLELDLESAEELEVDVRLVAETPDPER